MPIKIGSILTDGNLQLKITGIYASLDPASPAIPGGGMTVTFESNRPAELVRKLEFSDPSGKLLQTRTVIPVSFARDQVEGSLSHSFQCAVPQDLSQATLKVTYFDRVESARLPFDVIAGAGL